MVSISLYRSVSAVILMTEYISNAAAVGTTIVNENKTWADANDHCSDNFPSGRMASDREIMGLYNGGSPLLSDLPEYMWVADNRILTQWIRFDGCYSQTTIASFITWQSVLPENRPGLCQLYCGKFFALQNFNCYCLNDGFTGNTTDRMLCSACATTSNVNVDCGGSTVVNVYETVDIDVNPTSCNPNLLCYCVLAQCTASGNVLEYFNSGCSLPHETICDDGKPPSGEAASWDNKFYRCKIKRTYFLSKPSDLIKYICEPDATSQYWIGIFRTEVEIDFYVSSSPIECAQIRNTIAGLARSNTPDCGIQYPFLCIHTDTDNSGTTEPERVSSAQSTMDSTQTVTTLETTIQKPNDQTNLGAVLGPVAAVIVTVVIVLVVVLITIQRKNKQRKLASMKKEVHDSQEIPNNQIASSMRDESHYDITYDESEAGGFRGNNASHSKIKKAAEVEENAYDVTNRFNRKESAAESHYDHMCPQPNEGAIYNTVDRSVKSGDIMSENVYDHAVKQDNDIYDRAIRSQQLQNVHITENTYAHADLG